MKIFAIILFVAMYIVMIAKSNFRTYAALAVALIFCIAGITPIGNIFGAIDFNVLMMIAGTMIVVDYFIESKMPNLIAESLLRHSKNVKMVIILMSLFAGIVSAFIDNVATVIMIAPVGLAICKKLNINPTGMLLSIAVSSNLQGAATLVGDTTSIMLGAYAKMDFMSFFFINGKPGIFWAVELGALGTVLVMMILFRKEKAAVSSDSHTKVESLFPSFALIGIVVFLIAASFLPEKPDLTNGLICCAIAVICMAVDLLRNRKPKTLLHSVKSIDYQTLALLAGMFVVIAGLQNIGVINDLANFIGGLGKNNIFLLYTVIVWMSVLLSAFIDNIPYVATMLPVVQSISLSLGIAPYLLYFGLLSGATLGGNLTPVGASANIAATGILQKEGYKVNIKDFAKIGIPFTLTAVTIGYLFIWFVFGM
ncbi:MAG: arsenic transporter [Lachnospiraceae bacterium]|nr:arsenic transporter [Lachnospiraceae bacterium]